MLEAMQTILHDKTVLNAGAYVAAAASGQVVHAVKMWADGTAENPLAWMASRPRRTIASAIANLMVMAAFIGTGATDAMALGSLIALGLFQGYSADSTINKGEKKIWTDEERAAKTAGGGSP